MFTCKKIYPGDSLEDAFAVRTTVFVDEQGFSAENETDTVDPVAHHVVLYDGEQAVATGRIFPSGMDETWIIGRVAALSGYRGKGLGLRLMEEMETFAKELGAEAIELGAQCRVQGFYEKCGYKAFGDVYMDEHCPHQHMRKPLK